MICQPAVMWAALTAVIMAPDSADPAYRLAVDLSVRFDDGDASLFTWESWRYGWVLGPVTFGRPDGPPGRLRIAAGS